MENKYSICITTFKHRFDEFLKPLINQIKDIDDNIEIILIINGEYCEEFDNEYRCQLLNFIADKKNIFPVFFPQFRGLSKLWNTGMIHSSNPYTLMLNDDVSIVDKQFLNSVQNIINEKQTTFKINWTFSHVVFKKEEYIEIGGIPEILLGLGEEDGSFGWFYADRYGRNIDAVQINGIINHVSMKHAPKNSRVLPQGKYSQFNNEVMYNVLFRIDNINGKQYGMCPQRLIPNMQLFNQFPYEKFYLENKNKL